MFFTPAFSRTVLLIASGREGPQRDVRPKRHLAHCQWIRLHSGWTWPLNKDPRRRGKDERWAAIRVAVEDQASGSVHADKATAEFRYSRDETKALIAIAALLTVVDPPA